MIDKDIVAGLGAWRIWTTWSWVDVRQRYRRSKIGPFWMTINLGVTIAGMSYVFGSIFHTDLSTYVPYVAVGMIVWFLLSSVINESGTIFETNKEIIHQVSLPLTIHPLRMISRIFITFMHHMLIYVLVAIIFKIPPSLETLLFFPALILVLLNCLWVSLLLGILCVRFRDIPMIVTNFMFLLFLATPVFWRPEVVKDRQFIVDFNPLYHFIEIVRQPLLSSAPSVLTWSVVLSITIVGWLATLATFPTLKKKVPYWL